MISNISGMIVSLAAEVKVVRWRFCRVLCGFCRRKSEDFFACVIGGVGPKTGLVVMQGMEWGPVR